MGRIARFTNYFYHTALVVAESVSHALCEHTAVVGDAVSANQAPAIGLMEDHITTVAIPDTECMTRIGRPSGWHTAGKGQAIEVLK